MVLRKEETMGKKGERKEGRPETRYQKRLMCSSQLPSVAVSPKGINASLRNSPLPFSSFSSMTIH